MAAILKYKMATKRKTISNLPCALIISFCIINLGFATILSSLRSLARPKYVENGGHFEIQDGRQKENEQ